MKPIENQSQYTTILHTMTKHRVQVVLWDLIGWLDGEKVEEIQSVRDILSYIRLFTDFGDNIQGRLFADLIKRHKVIRLVLPEIADRLVSRGRQTGATWLEDLGQYIVELHKIEPHPGVGADREAGPEA